MWFKYDRDKLWLFYTQSVPVIFEPPCISHFSRVQSAPRLPCVKVTISVLIIISSSVYLSLIAICVKMLPNSDAGFCRLDAILLLLKSQVFWVVTLCWMFKSYQCTKTNAARSFRASLTLIRQHRLSLGTFCYLSPPPSKPLTLVVGFLCMWEKGLCFYLLFLSVFLCLVNIWTKFETN